MKKKIVAVPILSLVLIATAAIIQNHKSEISDITEANAEAFGDAMCEWGCLDGGNGCLCYVWVSTWKNGPGGEEEQ